MHFYAWKKGLKTGMYYLRSKSAADAIKFTVDHSFMKKPELEEAAIATVSGSSSVAAVTANNLSAEEAYAQMACSLDNPEACEACGS